MTAVDASPAMVRRMTRRASAEGFGTRRAHGALARRSHCLRARYGGDADGLGHDRSAGLEAFVAELERDQGLGAIKLGTVAQMALAEKSRA